MPRPFTILRYAAAAYAFGFGIVLLSLYLWECVRDGAAMVGGGVRHAVGAADAITFGLWLACVVFTGWRGMDREARA